MIHQVFRLVPRKGSGLHLGREGLDLEKSVESFPSDSLFAAMVGLYARLFGPEAVADFLAQWPTESHPERTPPFRHTSLFPFAGKLLLFPMPRMRVELSEEEAKQRPRVGKMMKKITYVSPGILERLLHGKPMNDWLPETLEDTNAEGLLLQGGHIWIAKEEWEQLPKELRKDAKDYPPDVRLWKVGQVPRVTVDRRSNRSAIYRVGRTVFSEECGLWLMAEGSSEGLDQLNMLLVHLTDEGIGGLRNVGYGAFKLRGPEEFPRASLLNKRDASYALLLSRYNPTPQEWQAGVLGVDEADRYHVSYELVDVGGWLYSPQAPAQRRKRVRMIEAGSVVRAPQPLVGRLVDVRPKYDGTGAGVPHPVYRSGIAFTLGMAARGH